VVRRCDGDGVQLLILQRFADVLDTGRRPSPFFFDRSTARREQPGIGINQVGDLHPLEAEVLLDVAIALSMNAGNADSNHIVGAQHPAGRLGSGYRDGRRGRQRVGEERTPSYLFHEMILSQD